MMCIYYKRNTYIYTSFQVAQFHPNGNYIATGSTDRTCRLWDINTGNCVRLYTGSKVGVCVCVCVCADENTLEDMTEQPTHLTTQYKN